MQDQIKLIRNHLLNRTKIKKVELPYIEGAIFSRGHSTWKNPLQKDASILVSQSETDNYIFDYVGCNEFILKIPYKAKDKHMSGVWKICCGDDMAHFTNDNHPNHILLIQIRSTKPGDYKFAVLDRGSTMDLCFVRINSDDLVDNYKRDYDKVMDEMKTSVYIYDSENYRDKLSRWSYMNHLGWFICTDYTRVITEQETIIFHTMDRIRMLRGDRKSDLLNRIEDLEYMLNQAYRESDWKNICGKLIACRRKYKFLYGDMEIKEEKITFKKSLQKEKMDRSTILNSDYQNLYQDLVNTIYSVIKA